MKMSTTNIIYYDFYIELNVVKLNFLNNQ